MKTMVIVGAGKGLGLSLAKRFGQENFRFALIARNELKLKEMVTELWNMGIEASSFPADLYDQASVEHAFTDIKKQYGFIDVVEFSQTPGSNPPISVLSMTDEAIMEQFEGIVLGSIHCVNQVVNDMIERGTGALLFTTGLSSVHPIPMMGNVGIALAGLRNYVANLHAELAQKGIYVGFLALGVWMKPNTGKANDPEVIADAWYQMYVKQEVAEAIFPEGVTPETIVM